ncbi:bifunctional enoyl-CoA hydratase/phosphate acetyltransferase [Beijerinckia indica]|uniref:Phosphate butyryltransferase n=1 Tax=Beijerinckia indica subsp. indica (strain ATCC 9039 / DSM 1715 / NCIMB 8712) TaxID=395963 RepID=B2IGR0_BEII9|nr:bifunctional enoyl-CoA hydratase/phosphate acetyltransferase [Beijerinckia indica]ACB95821.1 Phosphate butyryltransferase [Beijerinckia indica subsp. indica ATCC 9039]
MTDPLLHNRTFDELILGDTASLTRLVTSEDIQLFAAVSGDVNPAHLDAHYAATDLFGHVVIHGMWTASLISTLLGTQLPGPGTIYLGQNLHFCKPVAPGDTITARVTVKEKKAEKHIVLLDTICTNQQDKVVLSGTATVMAPTEKLTLPRMAVPEVTLQHHDHFSRFVDEARAYAPIVTAIVQPTTPEAIKAVIEAREAGLIEPVLVGPQAKISAAAEAAGVSIAGFKLEAVEHSHAAAQRAVALASNGTVAALMKGSLETEELLAAVVARDSGLRTDRRISHVYALDVPSYPKPLFISDVAINIAPTLEQKRDICQNAVDFLHLLGIAEPLVAVLAAVEIVNPEMPATVDAAALTIMATRGQISGAKVDGPLAFDNAVSFDAAHIKHISSPVAGQADLLIVPNLEAGNMLGKQLVYLAGAEAAGLVLGARVPIALMSRSDSLKTRLASLTLAKLAVWRRKTEATLP